MHSRSSSRYLRRLRRRSCQTCPPREAAGMARVVGVVHGRKRGAKKDVAASTATCVLCKQTPRSSGSGWSTFEACGGSTGPGGPHARRESLVPNRPLALLVPRRLILPPGPKQRHQVHAVCRCEFALIDPFSRPAALSGFCHYLLSCKGRGLSAGRGPLSLFPN